MKEVKAKGEPQGISRTQPLVSVVTPSYNQGRFVEDTILSVKNQDYPNIEHIIVDGDSTDGTLGILKKYEGTYNMRWVSEPDKGQSDAVNKGFETAKGQIIGWLNSDDVYFARDAVSKVVKNFKDFSGIDLIYGDIALIDNNNTVLKILCKPSYNYERLIQRRCSIAQPAVFLRKEVIKKHRLNSHLQYVMDYEFWLRVGKEHMFRHIEEVLAAFRVHAASKTIAEDTGKWENERLLVADQYDQNLGAENILLRFWDKLTSATPRRIEGLIKIIGLYLQGPTVFAFDAKLNRVLPSLLNQLVRRNKRFVSNKRAKVSR